MGGSSSDDIVSNSTSTLKYCIPSDDHSAGGLFITICLFAGLLCKIFLMDHIPVPYTVVVLVVGGGLGALVRVSLSIRLFFDVARKTHIIHSLSFFLL